MDDPIDLPKAAEKAEPIKLDEDTELRVLAGITALTESLVMEKAVSKAQQKAAGAALAAKRGDTPKSELKGASKEMMDMSTKELEKFAGTKHKGLPEKKTEEGLDMNLLKAAQGSMSKNPKDAESDKNVRKKYGYRMDGEPAERDDDETKQDRRGRKRKNTGEGVEIDTEKFKDKFTKMVEAKKEKMSKKDKKMDEGSKPDFLDVDKDGDKKEPMKKASKEADKGEDKKETKGLSAKQKKLPPGLQKAIAKKKGTAESVKTSKKVVAESVENKLSFKDMMKLVIESGGQQQIDPVDQTLWQWANRVASSKIQESQKAEIFAAMIYERNGGRFEMYDVLAEDQK